MTTTLLIQYVFIAVAVAALAVRRIMHRRHHERSALERRLDKL